MSVLVLGNVTVDEAMLSPVWPSAGQTVIVGAPKRDLGGKGANQAVVLKRAGAAVRLVAAVGQDDLAAWACDTLMAEGFAPDDLIRMPLPTDRSLIFVGPDGENAIASIVGCADAVTTDQARQALAGAQAGDVLLLQGNLSLDTTKAACAEARRRGLHVAFNPSPLREGFEGLLPLVDLLVVNESEARQLGGERSPEQLVAGLHGAGAGDVVLTLGGRGSLAFGRSGEACADALAAEVVDTTGAGDTYMGVLVAALFDRGLPIGPAMQAASAAAALTVGRRGTWSAFPSAGEIEAIFARL